MVSSMLLRIALSIEAFSLGVVPSMNNRDGWRPYTGTEVPAERAKVERRSVFKERENSPIDLGTAALAFHSKSVDVSIGLSPRPE